MDGGESARGRREPRSGTPVRPGRLVAFEGLDGCGKSTQLARLAPVLRAAGHDVLATREPTDGATGRRIRAMATSGERVTPQQELRWFTEDRREHVEREIAPALAAGSVVLTDRYYLSTVAYQGARGLDPQAILSQSEATFPVPDLVLLLEIDPEQGLARVAARGAPRESVFEQREFLERVASVFAALDRPYIARVDARPDADAVHARVLEVLAARLDLP